MATSMKRNLVEHVEEKLRQYLVFGPWKVTEKLPSEDALMAQFSVGRSTLRVAMKTLVAEGVIVRTHGSGTYLQRIPRKRIEIFIALDNLLSPGAHWYRW